MQSARFNTLVADMRREQDELLEQKGKDYTRHDTDRLANFKTTGGDIDVDTLKVWYIFAKKHWDAIVSYIKTGKTESEPIRKRFIDLQNYGYLGMGIIEEIEDDTILDDYR
jgi:hypothetical protein